MKKLHTFSYLAVATAAVVAPFMNCAPASAAASVSYNDYSALSSTLNNTYSYTKVYWTDDTKITVVKAAGTATLGQTITLDDLKFTDFNDIVEGETLTVLIEDSTAVKGDGEKMDVIYRVSDVHQWVPGTTVDETSGRERPNSYARLSFENKVYGSAAPIHPETSDDGTEKVYLQAGDPIIAWNQTHFADSLFTVQFCKKGTYVASSDSCTPAGVTNLTSAHWDFDVPNANKDDEGNYTLYEDKIFNGNEGIKPLNGTVSFYYDKNGKDTEVELFTPDSGFAVKKTNGASFDGIYYGNSVFTTVTGLTNSLWSYRYGGTNCGAAVVFGSAVPYAMPKPQKIADKDFAHVGETIAYNIKQEVPNNYTGAGDTVTFMSLYSNFQNIANDKRYLSFKITDSFDENLTLPSSDQVAVYNENHEDVTNNFTININGQDLEVIAKDTAVETLYGHTYTVVVPTRVNKEVTASPIPNLAKTVYQPTGGSETTLTSDPVETEIVYTVTVRHIDDETGKEIAESTTEEYIRGSDYETSEAEDLPDKYELVKTPDNASGKVNGDIVVTYRYHKIKNPNTFDDGLFVSISMSLASVAGFGIFVLKKRRG